MAKPVIALDADGVLLDYSLAYAGAWQRAFGRRPALRDPAAYWPIDRWEVERLEDDERLAQLRLAFDDEFWAPMARSNSPTLGHPKFPQAGRSDYDYVGVMAMREAASFRR